MKALRRSWTRLLGLLDRDGREREMSEEFASHIAMQTEANVRAGMDRRTAERTARIKFGSVPQAIEALRDQRGLPWLDDLRSDLRFGVRGLARNPGFTAAAVLTLSIGIGGTAAMFSVWVANW